MFNRTVWVDRDEATPNKYKLITSGDGTVLSPYPGNVRTEGTPLSAANFNNVEEALQHYAIAYDFLKTISQAEMREQQKKIEDSQSQINTKLRALRYEVGDELVLSSVENHLGFVANANDGGTNVVSIYIPTSKPFASEINDIEINDEAEITTTTTGGSSQRAKANIKNTATVELDSLSDTGVRIKLTSTTSATWASAGSSVLRVKLENLKIKFKHT